ncbi:MAG TPA: hypothetical protein VJG32_13880 [Anaerolineae bacterium]|nr:hypothetical protein [Anaerolineae bacterium]
MKDLRQWLNAGVRFTPNSSWPGDAWTAGNINSVRVGLNRVLAALGDKTLAALGLVNGGTLTFNKIEGTGVGGYTDQPGNKISLFLPKTYGEDAVETTIHEIGHLVDWRVRSTNAQWGWSAVSSEWPLASGWRRHHEHGFWYLTPGGAQGAPTANALTGVGEDFADTFTWYIEYANGYSYADAARFNPQGPNQARRDALSVALDELP